MNNKILAVIAVIIIIAAGAAAVLLLKGGDESKDDGLSIVGRVNSEGSGIILNEGLNAEDYITVTKEKPAADAKYIYKQSTKEYYVFNVATWGGKVFATPGAATIQHVQLSQLATLMGLKFVSYLDGTTPAADTLYFVAGVASYADYTAKVQTAPLVGYIIWEAQYSVALQAGCVSLALTNDLFEGHTCCVVATSNNYIKNDMDTLVAFLAVYSQAVDKINAAIADPESEAYAELIKIAKNRVSMPDILNDEQKDAAIKSALEKVTYLYADAKDGNLKALKADLSNLAEDLYNAGQINKSASDLGFKSYTELGNKFVDDTAMMKAVATDSFKLDKKTTVNVAAINGDIHQIAIWYAKDTGMFDAANIDLKVFPQSGGPAIYTVLANGEVDIGFLGAPPMTIRSMNAENIHA